MPESRFDDDEDWVGTPPEGRYTRDRAKPQFWLTQNPLVSVGAAVVVVAVIVAIVVALAH